MSNLQRCIAHNDFVMCLTQYLFFLFILIYSLFIFIYLLYYTEEDSVKSKRLLSSNFLSLFILINLILYDNHSMLIRWPSHCFLIALHNTSHI